MTKESILQCIIIIKNDINTLTELITDRYNHLNNND